MTAWLREPLVHLSVLGLGLFFLHGIVGGKDGLPTWDRSRRFDKTGEEEEEGGRALHRACGIRRKCASEKWVAERRPIFLAFPRPHWRAANRSTQQNRKQAARRRSGFGTFYCPAPSMQHTSARVVLVTCSLT